MRLLSHAAALRLRGTSIATQELGLPCVVSVQDDKRAKRNGIVLTAACAASAREPGTLPASTGQAQVAVPGLHRLDRQYPGI